MHTHSLTSLGIIKYLKKVQSITENSRLLTLMEAPAQYSLFYWKGWKERRTHSTQQYEQKGFTVSSETILQAYNSKQNLCLIIFNLLKAKRRGNHRFNCSVIEKRFFGFWLKSQVLKLYQQNIKNQNLLSKFTSSCTSGPLPALLVCCFTHSQAHSDCLHLCSCHFTIELKLVQRASTSEQFSVGKSRAALCSSSCALSYS